MTKDLYNNTQTVVALVTTAIATDTATLGAIIDTDGFESAKIALVTGAVTTGDITISAINESDDSGMSGATAIPAERIIGTAEVVTTANTASELGFIANKRYVQVEYTTDNTADLTATSTCELGHPNSASVKVDYEA